MEVFRFGEDVSVPVTSFGSAMRLIALTGEDTTGALQVAYLRPGGRWGRQEASTKTLLAVVAGSGRASGSDGRARAVSVGHAVSWDAGEQHEVTTDDGLTAVVLVGSFDVRALRVTRDIVLSEYDESWPDRFAELAARVWPAVAGVALRIDHVGSTSVPGLAAKPIIDMDVVVADEQSIAPAIERLATVGYRWRGDLGIEGRHAFEVDDASLPAHHLYLVVDGSRAHLDHVLLRDLLRRDAEARRRYTDLKRANVVLAAGDMDVYVAAKAALVAELLTRARAEGGYPPVDYWRPDVS